MVELVARRHEGDNGSAKVSSAGSARSESGSSAGEAMRFSIHTPRSLSPSASTGDAALLANIDEVNNQNSDFMPGENQLSGATQEQFHVPPEFGHEALETPKGLPSLDERERDGPDFTDPVEWAANGAATAAEHGQSPGQVCEQQSMYVPDGHEAEIETGAQPQPFDHATADGHDCQGESIAGGIQYELGSAMATEAVINESDHAETFLDVPTLAAHGGKDEDEDGGSEDDARLNQELEGMFDFDDLDERHLIIFDDLNESMNQ